jgi:hypothetical protein
MRASRKEQDDEAKKQRNFHSRLSIIEREWEQYHHHFGAS